MKSFDLGALEELVGSAASGKGVPIEIPLQDIVEDPEQPRKTFEPKALEHLAKSIKRTKVKSPISVKSKDTNGKYVINHGARRYRASIMAGKLTIPAFIDDEHVSADQMIENIQREDLTVLEIADWINRELVAGEKQAGLAERLGMDKSWVSRYASIGKAPDVIRGIAERCSDVTALCNLINLHKTDQEAVEQFIASCSGDDHLITRAEISALTISANEQAVQTAAPISARVRDDDGSVRRNGARVSATSSVQERPVLGLAALFQAQAANKPADEIISSLPDTERRQVGKALVDVAKRGHAAPADGFIRDLVTGLQSGDFASRGEGLYQLVAFLAGSRAESTDLLTPNHVLRDTVRIVASLSTDKE